MAVLPDTVREEVWGEFMRKLSERREAIFLNKIDLRAALNATDQWIDNNAAAFNASLPVAARTNLTTAQKAELFLFVAARRFLVT